MRLGSSTLAALVLFASLAYGQVGIRNFYDDNGQLFRALDSTGNLVEYDYDAAGNATQIRRSTVAPSSLAILNLAPQRGGANSTVTIYGQNFSAVAAGDTVMFNGATATVVSASATALVVSTPGGVTTGPVSVTVNGVTVTSGSLLYTVPAIPVITSISPNIGVVGGIATVTVQGSGLSGASFAFQGAGAIGVSRVNVASDTQASFTATVGQSTGQFVLLARADSGASSSAATAGNTFHVFQPAGDNYTTLHLTVFNTNYPTGTNLAVPPGSNAISQRFTTFNTHYTPGTNPYVPAGSNAESLLFSTNNTNSEASPVPLLSIQPLRAVDGTAAATAGVTTLVAGQTVEISLRSSAGFLPRLQFRVNGVMLASSANGTLDTYFTAPHGVAALTLQAGAQTPRGAEVESTLEEVAVTEDAGRTISGRALDAYGRPMPGAAVEWRGNGLTAEYFPFAQPVDAVPDLTGLTPARTAYVSALNFPNPREVFGPDPMGADLGPNFAARFSGKLIVAVPGVYRFQLAAQSGGRLRIDGSTLTDRAGAIASVLLTAGEHDVEAIQYAAGGAAAAQLLWTPPGGAEQVVPPAALRIRVSGNAAGPDGRFRLTVPAALTGIRVSLATAQGAVVEDQ